MEDRLPNNHNTGNIGPEKDKTCESIEMDRKDNSLSSDHTKHSQKSDPSFSKDKQKYNLKEGLHNFLIILGLIFGLSIATINETAVSTATETIAKDLNSFGSLTWIAAGYLLTVVAFSPLFGKLSDIFGRKLIELICISLFAIGCLGCALANNMTTLIIFRVISGSGGGGLISMTFIMAADVIPLERRAVFLGFCTTIFAISQIIGPILGGLISQVSWRIVFYVLAGMCIVLAVLVIFVLDLPPSEGDIKSKIKRVDFAGSISLIITMVTLILATTWGGHDYAWNSPTIIALFVVMLVFFLIFLYVQWKVAAEPILPAKIFVRNVILANITNFASGTINVVTVFYLPVYYQTVQGDSPTVSGYKLIPFLISISGFCLFSGYLIKIVKTIRGVMWVGAAINLVGVCLISFMRFEASTAEQIIFVMINGIGIGLSWQLCMLTCQITVAEEDVAIVSGFYTFILNVGAVIGLAIVGSVYNNVLVKEITSRLPEFSSQDLLIPNIANTLNEENKQILKFCYYSAFRYGYICLIPISIICLLSVLALDKISLPERKPELDSQA